MRKHELLLSSLFLTSLFLFTIDLNAKAQGYSRTIIGEVTLVGSDVLKIREDGTQIEYELKAPPGKLKEVVSGYRAEVKTTDGKVSSLTILGMPMKAEPQPFQKWTVIKYPEEGSPAR
jgi:hypothetical protein